MITITKPTLSHSPFVLREDRNAPPNGKPEKRFRSHFSLADSATTLAELAVPPDTKNIFFRYEQTAKKRSLKTPRLHLSSPYPPFVLSEGSGCTPSQLPFPPFVLSEGRGLYIRPAEAGCTTPCRSRRTRAVTTMQQCGTNQIRLYSSATPKLSRICATAVPLHGYATVLARDYNGSATGVVRDCTGYRQFSATGIPSLASGLLQLACDLPGSAGRG